MDTLSGHGSMPGLSMFRTIEGGAVNRVKGSDTQLEIVDTGEIVTID